jgi:hypothetical protein
MIGFVTAARLREWRGVKPVAGPAGVALTTRLWTTPEDKHVLDLVAEHLGRLRRADLAAITRPAPLDPTLDDAAKRQARRDRLNSRKTALTAESSARWANAIIAGNDAQYRLARDAQHRHLIGLNAAITTIEERLAQPTDDTLTAEERRARRKAKLSKGYPTQAERFQKQRRLQVLRAELGRVTADRDDRVVHVVEGGKRLAKTRHHLDAANLTLSGWRDRWDCARDRIDALGSGDEPFGNLTITVTAHGEVSLRLPNPLEHLANARRGRYVLSGTAVFSYRGDQWRARITGGKSVSYTITRKPGRAGRYLTAAWACPSTTSDAICAQRPDGDVWARGPVVGVDLNDGHLAVRPRQPRQPGRPTRTHRHRPVGVDHPSGCANPACDHPAHPLHRPSRHRHRGCGGPGFRRRPHRWPGNDGPRIARQTLPQHGYRYPHRGVPQSAVRADPPTRHSPVRGQPRLHQRMGRPALAQAV